MTKKDIKKGMKVKYKCALGRIITGVVHDFLSNELVLIKTNSGIRTARIDTLSKN